MRMRALKAQSYTRTPQSHCDINIIMPLSIASSDSKIICRGSNVSFSAKYRYAFTPQSTIERFKRIRKDRNRKDHRCGKKHRIASARENCRRKEPKLRYAISRDWLSMVFQVYVSSFATCAYTAGTPVDQTRVRARAGC
jgi:hypothetical protein